MRVIADVRNHLVDDRAVVLDMHAVLEDVGLGGIASGVDGVYLALHEVRVQDRVVLVALEHEVKAATLTRAALRDVALSHVVCPYHLGQEMARWCDVVVGDYNHYFDSSALLHGLTLENSWRSAVLVDEAHNLIDRARAMYTASLDSGELRAVRSSASLALRKSLDRLYRSWNRMAKGADEPYTVLGELPRGLVASLKDATAAIAEHLAANGGELEGRTLQFFYDALQFKRLFDVYGDDSIIDLTKDAAGAAPGRRTETTLCLRNLIPAAFLNPRFAAARSTVLFSATLAPWNFYCDTLGLPPGTAWLDIEAPFRAEQLTVRIAREVSTRFRHRDHSLKPIATIIARQFEAVPGNYIAFFSSFEYLDQALKEFSAAHPDVPVWHQRRRMDEVEREGFMARFKVGGSGVGFAVLGGTFAEGIDLVGTRLIGAFIATLGLPQVNPVNEELRRRLGGAFGAGYDYAYLYPGIRKVVQAAGRVIRASTDSGSVHLIDDRYARPDVLRLLPSWWRIEGLGSGQAPGVAAAIRGDASAVARHIPC